MEQLRFHTHSLIDRVALCKYVTSGILVNLV